MGKKDGQKEVIRLTNVTKKYNKNGEDIIALNDVSINFYMNKFHAIMGHSGSGKSTLINILGVITNPSTGTYRLYGNDVTELSDNELSETRMKHFGFVFQDFKLNPTLTAIENVMIPILINKAIKQSEREKLAVKLLDNVGLEKRYDHFPKELSGGEQQRVAIARALANNPDIILADEPTGNLDEKMEKEIFELLKDMSEKGKCIIVVSHSNEVKKYADVVYTLAKGKLKGECDEN